MTMELVTKLLSSTVGIAIFGLVCGCIVGGTITLLLWRRRTAGYSALQFSTRFMYSGNLKQTALLDAIQFLELGRRQGILHIYVGRRKGYVTFVGGQIVDAFFRNTTGREAIFQMLELTYGDFYFESKTINQPRIITESIMDIALEWDARKYGDQFQSNAPSRESPETPVEDILDVVMHETPRDRASSAPPPATRPDPNERPEGSPEALFDKPKGES